MAPPPGKSDPAAKTEHKPDEPKPNPLGNPEAGKAQDDPDMWRKECEPHTQSIVSEHGPAGGQDSSPKGK